MREDGKLVLLKCFGVDNKDFNLQSNSNIWVVQFKRIKHILIRENISTKDVLMVKYNDRKNFLHFQHEKN